MCLVGEEQGGLQRVIEVERRSRLERILGSGTGTFSGARRTRADRAERGIEVCGFWELVSCGTGERRRGTEQDLNGGEGLDDDHGPAAFGTAVKRAGLLGGGCCWFNLRLWYGAEYLKAEGQESSPPPVGEEAEVADADEAFGKQMQEEAAQELIERIGSSACLHCGEQVAPAEGDLVVGECD